MLSGQDRVQSETIEELVMVMRKSPGGSLFPYYYKGGELFGLHYGSFFTDEEGLLHKLAKKSGVKFPMPIRYFSDPEEAKTWLVSES